VQRRVDFTCCNYRNITNHCVITWRKVNVKNVAMTETNASLHPLVVLGEVDVERARDDRAT
jgi:hypothetical protein